MTNPALIARVSALHRAGFGSRTIAKLLRPDFERAGITLPNAKALDRHFAAHLEPDDAGDDAVTATASGPRPNVGMPPNVAAVSSVPTTSGASILDELREVERLYGSVRERMAALERDRLVDEQGVHDLRRLREWNALLRSAKDLAERLHAYRESRALWAHLIDEAASSVIIEATPKLVALLRSAAAALPDREDTREVNAKVEDIVAEQLPIALAVSARSATETVGARFGLTARGSGAA